MQSIHSKAALFALGCSVSLLVQAGPLDQAQQTLQQSHREGAQVQRCIDQLDRQTRENYEAYTAALRQAELVEAYNRQLARMVEDQSRDLDDIEAQLISLAQTEQATLPLLVR